FIYRAHFLPEDTLLATILPTIKNNPQSAWYKLQKNIIWQQLPEPRPETTVKLLKQAIRSYHQNVLDTLLATPIGTKTLAACRPRIGKDPISWLPMTRKDCSRCICWRLCWL
ncbi:hypothetical protein BDC45DRAFT_428857, partial [Circinella umbellata]